MIEEVIAGYAAAAPELIARYDALPVETIFAPVADLLPASPCRIADIGAGTGRDAAWLAGLGHRVTAVEPVAALREAGMALHPDPAIGWRDDRLPDLVALTGEEGGFDLILVIAVWQHLNDAQRRVAMRRLAALMAPAARLALYYRHGPASPGRPVHAGRIEDTIEGAAESGLKLVRRRAAQSVQAANRAAGVHWTWLVFQS